MIRETINVIVPYSNVYSDIKDGDIITKNPFFNDGALQVILFQDAFEVCNPLGSSKGKFKIVGIYMTLGNLPAYMRSKTKNFKLVALCKESDINKFGWDAILKCIIDDLLILETEGIKVFTDDNVITFKGSLLLIKGDNLGSHDLGKFVTSFNCFYFCRFCIITKEQLKSDNYKVQELRKLEYNLCVETSERTGVYCLGITGHTPLNVIENFHVFTGVPPYIAHDINEGIIQYDLLLIIKYFI